MQDQIGKRETEGGDAKESVRGPTEKENIVSLLHLSLAPLDSSDMYYVRSWRNDYRIWKWCRQNDFISDADQMRWFEAQAKDPTIKMYKIVIAFTKEGKDEILPVGVCGLTSIDQTNRRAEFSLYIAPAFQGKDFGQKALECLLTHGFKNLGLNVIWGEVFDGNPALKLFESIGFKHEGIRRDFYFRDGKFIDAHLISIKACEWK